MENATTTEKPITLSGIIRDVVNPDAFQDLHLSFVSNKYLLLPGFLDRFLLNELHKLISQADSSVVWGVGEYGSANKGLIYSSQNLTSFVNTLFNQPKFIDFLRAVTGIPEVESYLGYIYKTSQSDERALGWHQDLTDNRLVALSVNLNLESYKGGEVILRECDSKKEILRMGNTGTGDLLFIALAPHLEHCTTKPTENTSRLTLAGWGCAIPTVPYAQLY